MQAGRSCSSLKPLCRCSAGEQVAACPISLGKEKLNSAQVLLECRLQTGSMRWWQAGGFGRPLEMKCFHCAAWAMPQALVQVFKVLAP